MKAIDACSVPLGSAATVEPWVNTVMMKTLLTLGIISSATLHALADPIQTSPARLDLPVSWTALRGELTLKLPADAVVEARAPDPVTGIAPVQGDDSRARLEVDGVRCEVIASETYGFAPKNPAAAVQQLLRQEGVAIAVLQRISQSDLVGYAVTPKLPRPSEQIASDILIYRMYVSRPGSTVKELSFYVDPVGLGNSSQWLSLSKRIGATISITADDHGAASKEHVATFGPRYYQLQIEVPKGWSLHAEVDSVYHETLHGSAPLGTRLECEITVASTRGGKLDASDVPDAGAQGHSSQIMGLAVQWKTRDHPQQHEATTALLLPASQLSLSIACSATNESDLTKLEAAIASLRRATSPASP